LKEKSVSEAEEVRERETRMTANWEEVKIDIVK
jgi:hypothetical protein